jgi:hypothetical protein
VRIGIGKRGPNRIPASGSQVRNQKQGTWQHLTPKRKCHDVLSRKEVIQPQVLLRLPCYDFTPIMSYTLGGCLLAVSAPTSSTAHFRDVTGGVYKARERIHRGVLIRDY